MKCYDLQELFHRAPELDYESGMKYFLGNLKNYRRGLLACIKSIQHKLPVLNEMYQTEDYTGLIVITMNFHTLMSNIGACEIVDISKNLEIMDLNHQTEDIHLTMIEYIEKLEELSTHLKALVTDWDSMFKGEDIRVVYGKQNFMYGYGTRVSRG